MSVQTIRCKLEREGGTQVTLGLTTYHFAPNDDGAHIAKVSDDEHAARFLEIPEAYEVYTAKPPPVRVLPDKQPVATVDIPPKGALGETMPPGTASGEAAGTTKPLTRKQLEKAYKAKFGKVPNARSKDETILAALTGATNG